MEKKTDEELQQNTLERQESYRRFYDYCKSKKYYLSEVARRADIPRYVLSDWSRGKAVPKTATMLKLCKTVGVSPEYILTGIEPELPEKKKLNARALAAVEAASRLTEADLTFVEQTIQYLLQRHVQDAFEAHDDNGGD